MITFNGVLLKSEIVRSGKSQREIATALGVHDNTLSQWIRGIITPSADKLAITLSVIGWQPAEIAEMPFCKFYSMEDES